MHYNNVFLVRADTRKDALQLTKEFLAPYNEGLEVDPYKDYATENDIKWMAEHYHIDPSDLQALAEKMIDWDGAVGGVDEQGLFSWSTYNPKGEWDWYQWGGRWMWSDLDEKYTEAMSLPHTDEEGKITGRYYGEGPEWNHGIIQFPDGTVDVADSPIWMDSKIKRWVDAHPEWSEVRNADHPEFFKIIDNSMESRQNSINWDIEQIAKYQSGEKEDRSGMLDYYLKSVEDRKVRWTTDSYFWNITDDCFCYDKQKILEHPEEWFIVNVDLHT